jgi:hypothetical protein
MPPDPESQPPSSTESAAEIQLLLSADDTGRVPFPEGRYREIAVFLEALGRLDGKGHIAHRLHNGFLGCYLTGSGMLLRSRVMAARNEEGDDHSEGSMFHHPACRVFLPVFLGLVLWKATPVQARLGETPERVEARYGVPVKVENGMSARDFQCTYKHGGITIVVHFLDEKSQDECFANDNGDPIAADELQRLLEVNRRGGKWNLKEDNGSAKNGI